MHSGRARGSAIWARRFADVRSAGDLDWFEPALARIKSLSREPGTLARNFLSLEDSIYIARAPGRLDVMGGIADYSGATVLQMPLDCSTFVALQWHDEPTCELLTRRAGRWDHFSTDLAPLVSGSWRDPSVLASWFAAHPEQQWAAYVLGVIHYCIQRMPSRGRFANAGIRLLIDSTIPEGRGVSSSAALEVAALTAVATAIELEIAPEDLAIACQWVENTIAGAPCGIMDQMTSECGQVNRLMRLRCQPGSIEGHLAIPNGFRFYGIDSGVRHAVTGADYGTVRTAAFMGYRMIAAMAGLTVRREEGRVQVDDPRWHGYLANIPRGEFVDRYESRLPDTMTGAQFRAEFGETTDSVTRVAAERTYPVRQATAHPVYEQERVLRFAEVVPEMALRADAAIELGRLMRGSHDSYSACGLGSDGTDSLVALVDEAGPERGLFGAKITGGGSGGTVAVLGTSDAIGAVREVAARYAADSGRTSEVFAGSSPGVSHLGTLIYEP